MKLKVWKLKFWIRVWTMTNDFSVLCEKRCYSIIKNDPTLQLAFALYNHSKQNPETYRPDDIIHWKEDPRNETAKS